MILSNVHKKPVRSLSDHFFSRLKKYLRTHETEHENETENDVVYMPIYDIYIYQIYPL